MTTTPPLSPRFLPTSPSAHHSPSPLRGTKRRISAVAAPIFGRPLQLESGSPLGKEKIQPRIPNTPMSDKINRSRSLFSPAAEEAELPRIPNTPMSNNTRPRREIALQAAGPQGKCLFDRDPQPMQGLFMSDPSPWAKKPSVPKQIIPDSAPIWGNRFANQGISHDDRTKRVEDTTPFYDTLPHLLEGFTFVDNGGQQAVFKKEGTVVKIPISTSLKILPAHHAATSQTTMQTMYQILVPEFKARFPHISLTKTEFCREEEGYYTLQPFYSEPLCKEKLTKGMIENLRTLFLSGIRVDPKPSNFRFDPANNVLQFVDPYLPNDEDVKTHFPSVLRSWNAIDPQLGYLFTERDQEQFSTALEAFFAAENENRP